MVKEVKKYIFVGFAVLNVITIVLYTCTCFSLNYFGVLINNQNIQKRAGCRSSHESYHRQEHLQRTCQSFITSRKQITVNGSSDTSELITIHSEWSVRNFTYILVDKKRKFLFCIIPKVASTNFKRMFLHLTGKLNIFDTKDLPSADVHGVYQEQYLTYLSSLPQHEVLDIIQNQGKYMKAVFVREPMSRLISAYRNKFTTKYNEYYKTRYGTHIIARYRPKATKHSLRFGDDVMFQEFVQHIIDNSRALDVHWRPYHKLCHPCLFRYDFIGKYETFEEDVRNFMRYFGAAERVAFPSVSNNVSKTSGVMAEHFNNLTDQQLLQLLNIYHQDYKLFDYPYPPLLLK